jgi:hypothetical protein
MRESPVTLLISQRLREAAWLDIRRIRAETARHDGADAGQRAVELFHGKEKSYPGRRLVEISERHDLRFATLRIMRPPGR